MADHPSVSYTSTISRLTSQYGWRMLPAVEWAAAASQLDPAPVDERAARRACLSVYARTLYEACQDPSRQEQAYRELYDYLCVQAAYRGPHLACDFAQEAIILVFRSFHEEGRAQCSRPEAFLLFARFKLWDAIKRVRRFSDEGGRSTPMSDLMRDEDEEEPMSGHGAPPRPEPLEDLLVNERLTQARSIVRLVALEVLDGLLVLWSKPKPPRRQLVAAILTHLDEAPDSDIARRLLAFDARASSFGDAAPAPTRAQIENVQVLRSLGLDKLRAVLQSRLDLSSGGLL